MNEILTEIINKLYNAIYELDIVIKNHKDKISIKFNYEKIIDLVLSMFKENIKNEIDDIAIIKLGEEKYKIKVIVNTINARMRNNYLLIPLEVSYHK